MAPTFDPQTLLRPSVFIGSSSTREAKDLAVWLEADLRENGIDAFVWSHDVFQLGRHTLTELTRFLDSYDFGVLVFWPDDDLTLRGTEYKAARDNVILELGMFLGALGPERALILRNRKTTRWLSDLAGLGVAEFEPDSNLKAAASAAILEIREAIRRRYPLCIRSHDFANLDEAHAYMSVLLKQGTINIVRQASLSKFAYWATKFTKQFTHDLAEFVAQDGNAYCYVYNPVVTSRETRVKQLLVNSGTSRLSVRELSGDFPDDTRNFILFDDREVIVVDPRGRELPNRMRLHRRPDIIQFYEAQFAAHFAAGRQASYWPAAGE